MKNILGDKVRLISSITIVAIIFPIFAITHWVTQYSIGPYIGSAVTMLIGMLGLYEIIYSMNVNKWTAIFMSLSVIAFFLLSWDNYQAIATYDSTLHHKILWSLQDWKPYIVILVMSFIPILTDSNYRKKSKNLLIDQIIIIFVIFSTTIFAKCLWAIAVFSFWDFLFFISIAIVSDIFAYLGGLHFGKKWFGGKKFAPIISPKKTYAGFVIGLVVAITFSVLVGYFAHIWKDFGEHEILTAIISGVMLSLVSPYADLTYSAIKRWKGIKDFSNLIPGHGGIFDRVDAMCTVVVFASFIWLAV